MRRALLVAFFLLSAAPWSSWGRADDLALTPRRGMLLLNNGELIEGTITASGDRYDVTLNDGEIHIKRSQVAFLGRDALACYEHKRSGIEEGRAQDYLDLAEWCLRHALLDEAGTEIAAAKAADSTHPKIRLLETRLTLARENLKPREPVAAGAKAAPAETLDALVRNLPAGSMETFTNNIQPLLLNYCTKSGCHGSQSAAGLRLERIPPNRHAGRKPTQRNLQTALAMIDRDQPEESKLLKTPIRPHGTAKQAIFTDRDQSQYKQLVQWVYLVAGGKQQAAAPPTLEERGAPLRQTVPRRGGPIAEAAADKPKLDAKNVTWSDSFPDQSGAATEEDAPADGNVKGPPRGPLKPPPASADFVPKDAFDPEIFNRRYFNK